MSSGMFESFAQLPAMGAMRAVGLKALGLVAMILIGREFVRLMRGGKADFVGVAGRVAIAAMTLTAIPQLSLWVSNAAVSLGGSLMSAGIEPLMKKALQTAVSTWSCAPTTSGGLAGIMSAVGAIWSFMQPSTLLFLLAEAAILAAIVVKIVVIDVLWPVSFAIVVYAGFFSLPLQLAPGMGGMATYARNVAAVALWPVVFGLLTVLMSAAFSQTLGQVARGEAALGCATAEDVQVNTGDAQQQGASVSVTPHQPGEDEQPGALIAMQFIAIALAFTYLTWKTPAIAAAITGGGDMNSMGGQMLAVVSGLALRAAGKK